MREKKKKEKKSCKYGAQYEGHRGKNGDSYIWVVGILDFHWLPHEW